jgi:hypothetical protein
MSMEGSNQSNIAHSMAMIVSKAIHESGYESNVLIIR